MITFNNIVERFKVFADAHFFVKSFSFGSPDDVDLSKFTSFPLMHLVYTGATYDAGTKTYNLEVYILDVPADKTKKTDRQKEVVSDAEQCAEDIIADIKNGGNIFLFAQDYEVVNATTTPLEEETKNVLSGVLLDLSVSIPYEWDACNAPIDGVSPEGGDEVAYSRRGILRMLTVDGSTDVLSVRTIKVTNGTLTDDGDGVVTLDTGGAESLDDLDDVTITAPLATGQVIVYDRDASPRGFHNQENSLANLTDTNITSTPANAFLRYVNGAWEAVPVTIPSPPPSTTDGLPEGETNLYYTEARVSANTDVTANTAKVGITAQQASDITTNNAKTSFPGFGTTEGTALEGDTTTITTDQANAITANTAKVGITTQQADDITANNAKVSLIAGGTTGQALVKSTGTDYDVEWADIAVDVQYHDRFQTDAETFRSGATDTVELYYTAKADGDGLAESASSDTPSAGKIIRRKIYYSEAAFADPDTGTWVEFTPAPADDASFATVKAALLEYLKARTGGTVPISLKQTWEEVAQAPAFTGLLNEAYGSGAAAAYSVRRLNGLYTGAAIQVERSSDNTTQDIGFDVDGNLDESALTTFCTGTTCKVRTWYDQSVTGGTGSGNDAVQTDHTKQPTIYTGGAIVKENGRVAVDFDGANTYLNAGNILSVGTGSLTTYTTAKTNNSNNQSFYAKSLFGTGASRYAMLILSSETTAYVTSSSNQDQHATGVVSTTRSLYNQEYIANSTHKIYLDGNQLDSFSSTTIGTSTHDFEIGAYNDASGNASNNLPLDGNIQELIVYLQNQSSNRTSIESNIGGYFTQNTPLLDTYTGAAAAYSLRKLRSAYSGSAIRVRRASDNTEQDIGFNVFGELDTVSLASFCSGTDGFVKTWYDQASTNDATQTTAANQPKIYDSVTGVVTEGSAGNEKPAVEYNNDVLIAATSATITSESVMIVATQSATGRWNRIVSQNATGTNDASSYIPCIRQDNTTNIGGFDGSLRSTVSFTYDQQFLFEAYNTGSALTNYLDTVAGSASSYSLNETIGELRLGNGRGVGANEYLIGNLQEVIVYHSDQSSNRTNIEDNINTFYSIY